jgi:hypothetical protein
MFRWAYLLTAFVALAAWAGAQGPVPPAPLSPEDKLRLLRTNGALIDSLVNDGVAMSVAGGPEARAERCRSASLALVNAIRAAAEAGEAERVAELTGLFRVVVRDGLVPTINDGLNTVPAQSPAAVKLREVRGLAAADVTDLRAAAATGKLADSPRVRDALKQLDELTEALK